MSDGQALKRAFYPEARVGGFSRADVSIEFYNRINALLRPDDRVLDFGAGRGGQIESDPVPYRRRLKTFRGRCAKLDGCDLDPAVFDNPFLDEARLIDGPEAPLPYDDATFDLVFCSWVFEHVARPERTCAELLRILKPGGHVCALTVNGSGYLALAARLAGNRNHARLLRHIQPERIEHDVFPTVYRLNSPGAIARHFGPGAETIAYRMAGEPAYHFNRAGMYGALKLLHAVLPPVFRPALLAFVRKR